jgi:exodeoxyribonuclease V alpha subunit
VEDTSYIQIEGTVASIVYQNADNGYTVLRLTSPTGLVTAVGTMPGVNPGEVVTLTGTWTTHQSYGEQFKAEFFDRRMPSGREAIYSYLASGVIKNVGPAKARDIVDKFGDRTLEVIENEPEKLAEVRGITQKRALEVSIAFRRQVGLRRLLDFLNTYGIKPIVAVKLFQRFGDEALTVVKENPYIMTDASFGADFFEADSLALGIGFDSDCAERVEAAVLFELYHNLDNGHTFLPYDKLVGATSQLIEVPSQTISDALDALVESGYVVRQAVAGQDACYISEFQEAEYFVSNRLLSMTENPADVTVDVDRFVHNLEREYGITYAEKQRQAVHLAAESRVMVLTGGPGTGKTTSVRGILALLDALGLKTVLCAPTGRAAKRMCELTGREAATIHRLLGAGIGDGDTLEFEHDENNTLNADAVIVDETSMVDITLMRALLAAMNRTCRLVLVGDADQLPSVGPGNVFSDIIRSGAIPAVVLDEIFRQAGESGIVKNAHLINKGIVPDFAVKASDFFFLKRGSADKTMETIIELCAERLPKNMNIDPSQIQVLSPTRKNQTGTESLNLRLQAALNPQAGFKKEKAFGEIIFREGDKVMQIRNNYDILWRSPDGRTSGAGVFNGDIGHIKEIDFSRETLTVDYEDKLVTYLFEQLSELEPAFALTVHKSQGSEYKAVVLAVYSGAPQLLVRSVLYTAVTRARELLIVVGDQSALEAMVSNDRRQRRYSGLRARLAGDV